MQRIGSRCQVMHGNAKMTGGGLTRGHLKYNTSGKIVSIKASNSAKKAMRLQKAGYVTTKGGFGVKKMSGGDNNNNNGLFGSPVKRKQTSTGRAALNKRTRDIITQTDSAVAKLKQTDILEGFTEILRPLNSSINPANKVFMNEEETTVCKIGLWENNINKRCIKNELIAYIKLNKHKVALEEAKIRFPNILGVGYIDLTEYAYIMESVVPTPPTGIPKDQMDSVITTLQSIAKVEHTDLEGNVFLSDGLTTMG